MWLLKISLEKVKFTAINKVTVREKSIEDMKKH
jgi:hypothetical protein